MRWKVNITRQVDKKLLKVPAGIFEKTVALIKDISLNGPVRGNWLSYGKLDATRHHCHLKKGKPTYVAEWEVKDKEIKLVE